MARRSALALVLAAALAGCAPLLGQRYTDFRAYYNTFYNARQAFERAEREVLRVDPPIDRARLLPLFPEAAAGRGAFEPAIRKAADLLREHPDSRWVEDALLLLGKAYFYQGNPSAAVPPLRTLLASGSGRHADEAVLWLARARLEEQAYAEAADVLREGMARARPGPAAAAMQLLLGEVEARRGALDAAAHELAAGLTLTRDRELVARAAFLLGQVHELRGDPERAAEAFGQTVRLRPRSPELTYAAELQYALARSRAGHAEEALAALQRLGRDRKYTAHRAEIELQRGRVLAAAGRYHEAVDHLRHLLYAPPPDLRTDALRDRLHLRLAEVYRDGLDDLARAAAHFDTAAVLARRVAPAALRYPSAEAPPNLEPLARAYGAYAAAARRVADLDSLLALGMLDDAAFAEALEAIRRERARDVAARAQALERSADVQRFGEAVPASAVFADDDPLPAAESTVGAASGSAATGFLGYRDPVRVQEALTAFEARWGRRPLVPNWRRAEAVTGVALRPGGTVAAPQGPNGRPDPRVDEPWVDVAAVPRTPEAQRRMRAERATARYELGTALFLQLGRPEEAAVWFRRVLEEDADLPVALRAAYALAEVEYALGRTDRAEALFARLAEEHPDHPLGRAAAERLGRRPDDPPADEHTLAERAYAAAFARWERGETAQAFADFLDVAVRFPATPLAARARLGAALAYTEWARGHPERLLATTPPPPFDAASLPLDEAMPDGTPWLVALYADLEVRHPETPYAERARRLREGLLALYADHLAPAPPSAEATDPPPAAERPAHPPSPLRGGGPVDPAAGGYTWVVASAPDHDEAEARAAPLRAAGYRVVVLPGEVAGRPVFRVGLGQFTTPAEAARYRAELPPEVPHDTWLLALQPGGGR